MDIITKEDFDKAKELPEVKKPIDISTGVEMDQDKFEAMLEKMKNPLESQKELAIRIKMFLENEIDKELTEFGTLSDNTRKWAKEYNEILDKIHKSTHGEKSVNLHLHEVRHSHIATKIRQNRSKRNDTQDETK